MRTFESTYFSYGTDDTPNSTSASTSGNGAAPPTQMAECDHVDWVRYLIAVLIREEPSTSSTSHG